MSATIRRASLSALHHLSVLLGIVLLPIAVLARWTGVTLPVHRLVARIQRAYDRVQ